MHDLNKVVGHVLTLSEPELKKRAIETDIRYHSALPLTPMERGRVEQVLFHIITNAIEAMAGQETRKLRILTRLTRSADQVRVVISAQALTSTR